MATHLTRLVGLLCWVALLIELSGCSSTPRINGYHNETYHLSETVPTAQARKIVVESSIAQLGKPYKLSGNSPTEGFDCSGLVFYSYLNVGKLVPRRAEDQFLSVHKTQQVLPGDLVFFTTDSHGKHVDHVGIYIGNNKFIHAPGRGKSVTTASLTEEYWKKRLVGAGNYWN